MEDVSLSGHQVPIITKGQVSEGFDQTHFLDKNRELESDIGAGDAGPSPIVRKSELVEIQTPTSRILYKISSIFPFDIVPDYLVIDEIKVSITYRGLITRRVSSVLIKDITDILYNSTLFLASLRIKGGEFTDQKEGPLALVKLWPQEAKMARRIILGLMIFSDQKVDTSSLSIEELNRQASELGKSREA